MEPGILMNPRTGIILIWRDNLLPGIVTVIFIKCDLIVTRLYILSVWKQPNLKELHRFIMVFIVFAVCNTNTCAHHLHVTVFNHCHIAHAVFVFQVTFKGNGNYFHIVMRVTSKAHTGSDKVVVKHTQHSKVHSFRVVIVCKTESVSTLKPAVVCNTTGF